ncbi:MAG: response regulator [Bdellovibrionales bacterium]|nr:response regulator [Bdellovibrionales bacterium]
MPKIMVVDDNPQMRMALKQILEAEKHQVVEAENGKIARELIPLESPDIIISDFQMPFLDGLELLRWVKMNQKTPFILITAFGHIIETQQAFKDGADDFLTKPFKKADILAAIQKILSAQTPETPKNLDQEFCRIPIDDFISNDGIRIGIHIRLSPEKYLRVAHQGDDIQAERVDHYKSKGVDYLYAKKDEFALLVGFNIKLAKMVKSSTALDFEKKTNFLRYTTETVMENMMVNGVHKTSFNHAKECMKTYVSLLSESESIFQIMSALNSHGNWLYGHSLGVSVYSIMIGKKLGWTSTVTFFKLGMAGLFHDIGSKEIDLRILEKDRLLMNNEERTTYETHPYRGKEILERLPEVSGEVVQIVYDHHENCTGQGYPRHISKDKIHPLSKVIAVADHFCYQALKSPYSTGAQPREIVDKMIQIYSQELDGPALHALGALCM